MHDTIPRIIHQIWLGPLIAPFDAMASWKNHHPGWEYKLWTEGNLPPLVNQLAFDQSADYPQKADILRYELLHQFGGVYADADEYCLKPIDGFIENIESHDYDLAVGYEGRADNSALKTNTIMMSNKGNDFIGDLIAGVDINREGKAWQITGPLYLTDMIAKKNPEIFLFPSKAFYPIHHSEKKRRVVDLKQLASDPEIYGVHLWGGTKNSYEHIWYKSPIAFLILKIRKKMNKTFQVATSMDHTIAILGFNHHEITLNVLDDLLKRNPNSKILFFDNGSVPSYKDMLPEGVQYIREEKNIYVNPAWNKIFDLVDTKYLTLLNNDCLPLRGGYFESALADMESNNLSMTSLKTIDVKSYSNFRLFCYGIMDKLLNILPINPVENVRRQGWLMTINMEHYKTTNYKIPDEVKVWYGDDWIWWELHSNGYKYAVYRNTLAIHVQSTTTSSEFIKKIIKEDTVKIKRYDVDFSTVVNVNKRLKWFR